MNKLLYRTSRVLTTTVGLEDDIFSVSPDCKNNYQCTEYTCGCDNTCSLTTKPNCCSNSAFEIVHDKMIKLSSDNHVFGVIDLIGGQNINSCNIIHHSDCEYQMDQCINDWVTSSASS